ncbi:MAG: WYL domain-containing protein, partial [Ilumatobacteraceae bacterium]
KLGGATDGEPSVVANVPTLDALPVLREAAASRSIVEFRYHGVDRVIEPYSLLLREGFWYIIGLDHGHGEVRTYRVDRIDGEPRVGAPQSFERPVGFDPRASFPSDPKQLGASGPEGDGPSMATVWIEARRAVLLIDELGVDAVVRRCSDGSVIVEVACANVDAFRSWLFGLGDRATVLGPPDVRASIVDWLRQSAGQVAT